MSSPPAGPSSQQSHPERVLSQALRAMAGGRPESSASADDRSARTPGGLTSTQILLIAAIIGVVVGMSTSLVLLLLG